MKTLALALVALPLAASAARTYTVTARTKYTSACVANTPYLEKRNCATAAIGETRCDTLGVCNSFVKNENDGFCYYFNMPDTSATCQDPVSGDSHA